MLTFMGMRRGLGFWLCAVAFTAQGAETSALACYEAAERSVSLTREEALDLCRGASSNAPFQCFEEAREKTLLSSHEAVELCRCSDSPAPAACYERAREQTDLSSTDRMDLCSPSRQYSLNTACVPDTPFRY